ncbi:MAG: D-glycero-beta-D-manno-heptose 1-phosphate adenylyltransferase [Desulfovibrio sp.]|jgi:rfaE bifunctional protein nucleotidyltransferase chain/domain|nr:D-glycero-beta-D-manno-heptose 1-phosphate adenylyltransferase [Desulfovibrio sp.]
MTPNLDLPDVLLPGLPAGASRDRLFRRREELRAQGKVLVFTNGCFDLLHPGHVDLLSRARAAGDALILGLNSDVSVRSLGKGRDRPVNPFPVRAFVLAHLACVDFVVGFDEENPENLIHAIEPDVLVKGGDWSVEKIVGADFVRARGGKVLSLPLLGGFSTTALLERIRACQ